MTNPNRPKRRYTLMRQEIIQAAQEIIREKGVDGLSMRSIARIVHTSPANLYEYFLNKEEIIFSVYNEVLTNLYGTLQQVPQQATGRAYLLSLCLTYIDFIYQDPYQIQVISQQLHFEQLKFSAYTELTGSSETTARHSSPYSSPHSSPPSPPAGQDHDPIAATLLENTKAIYGLFLQAVDQCIAEGTLSTTALQPKEMTHVIWAFIHGLITLSIQEISTIRRTTVEKALDTFLTGLAT